MTACHIIMTGCHLFDLQEISISPNMFRRDVDSVWNVWLMSGQMNFGDNNKGGCEYANGAVLPAA